MKLTVATFNAENLFTRFKFRGKPRKVTVNGKKKTVYTPFTPTELSNAVENGFIIDKTKFQRVFEDERVLTAKAMKGVKADVLGLQEVENLDTLKTFNSQYLKSAAHFDFPLVIDGNDPRFIDVAVLSNFPFDFVRTHQYQRSGKSTVFSRDCLEVHVRVGQKTLPIFVNHLKSMMGGRGKTKARRELQTDALQAILKDRFGANFGNEDFVVLGDLNDYIEPGQESESGIRGLLQSPHVENVVRRLPPAEQWTHYWDGHDEIRQLDYLLLSRTLAQRNPNAVPVIERRGLVRGVNRPGQPPRVTSFFPETTATKAASDHCPVAITIDV